MLPESSFKPEHRNTRHLIVLQNDQIPQEAKDGLASLPEGEYNSITTKSPRNAGRTNFF